MIIQEKECVHGSPLKIVIPASAKFMQIIQLRPTDAARVGLRVRELPSLWGVDDAGNPSYTDLAIGDRIPMPLTTDRDGPAAHNYEIYIPYGPGQYGVPEIAVDYSTRVVLAFAERRDGSDLWMPHQRWADVQQHWETPLVSTLEANFPADYDMKNLATVPCKGFRRGVLEIQNDNIDNPQKIVCVSVHAIGSGNRVTYCIPLTMVPAPPAQGGAYPSVAIPFIIPGGTYDRLKVRAWAFDDQAAGSLGTGVIKLFADDAAATGVPQTSSAILDLGAAGLDTYAAAIYMGDLEQRQYVGQMWIRNDIGSLTAVSFRLTSYMNVGMQGANCAHRSTGNTGLAAAVAANAQAVATLAGTYPSHCAIIKITPDAAAQADCLVLAAWRFA